MCNNVFFQKLQLIHTINGDGSKNTKKSLKGNINRNSID